MSMGHLPFDISVYAKYMFEIQKFKCDSYQTYFNNLFLTIMNFARMDITYISFTQ